MFELNTFFSPKPRTLMLKCHRDLSLSVEILNNSFVSCYVFGHVCKIEFQVGAKSKEDVPAWDYVFVLISSNLGYEKFILLQLQEYMLCL